MKGDPQAIAHLQAQLKNELTAINQYFVHYRMLKHWGLDKLAKKEYSESIGEMKHADWLMDRIFMLDGLPNLQDLGKLNIAEDVPEMLRSDLALERGAQATIKDGIAHCESVRDYVSRDLLQDMHVALWRSMASSSNTVRSSTILPPRTRKWDAASSQSSRPVGGPHTPVPRCTPARDQRMATAISP